MRTERKSGNINFHFKMEIKEQGYQKMPNSKKTYLAYIVAIRDPLNLHLDIYWPKDVAKMYDVASSYNYKFVSEELEERIYERKAYLCHLRGVEIITTGPDDYTNIKEAYVILHKKTLRVGGWILVTISDIDIYQRILVNIFDMVTRKSINQELLDKISNHSGKPIAKEYVRPPRNKPMFFPVDNRIPKDYHIVYDKNRN